MCVCLDLIHSSYEFSAEALVDSLDRNDFIAVEELLFMKGDMFPQDWEAIVSEIGVARPWLLHSVEPNRSKNFTWSNELDMWVDSTCGIDIPFEDDIPF